MDVTRLTQGQKIAAGSAVALFVIMFLKWFGVEASGQSVPGGSLSAWEAFSLIDLLLLLTIIAAVALAFVVASRRAVNVPLSTIVTGLGALSLLFLLIRLISPPDIEVFGFDVADTTRAYGLYLGILATIGVTAGGWMAMQEEGTSFQDAADRLGGRRGPGAGGPGEPPAPPPPPPPSSGAPPSGGPPPSGGA